MFSLIIFIYRYVRAGDQNTNSEFQTMIQDKNAIVSESETIIRSTKRGVPGDFHEKLEKVFHAFNVYNNMVIDYSVQFLQSIIAMRDNIKYDYFLCIRIIQI